MTQEGEEDLRYFVETYQRSLRSVTLLADEEGVLTEGYQVGTLCPLMFVFAFFFTRFSLMASRRSKLQEGERAPPPLPVVPVRPPLEAVSHAYIGRWHLQKIR